jgi:alpha-L-fucosidase
VRRYKEFGDAIRNIYGNRKGETSGKGRTLELRFAKPTLVNHIIAMENIRYGQVVRAYEVDGLINGRWQKLVDGTSIGYKRIDVIVTVAVEALRLRVTEAVDEPVIKSFAAYATNGK